MPLAEYDFRHFYSMVAAVSLEIYATEAIINGPEFYTVILLAIFYTLPTWFFLVKSYELSLENEKLKKALKVTWLWGFVNMATFFCLPKHYCIVWHKYASGPELYSNLSVSLSWPLSQIFGLVWLIFYKRGKQMDWLSILNKGLLLGIFLFPILCIVVPFLPFIGYLPDSLNQTPEVVDLWLPKILGTLFLVLLAIATISTLAVLLQYAFRKVR